MLGIVLVTNKVFLIPYLTHHVPQYHVWMQDPDIQATTASEPLTLQAEFAMQRSWREDHDKLTFISTLPFDASMVNRGSQEEQKAMLGDINLFISMAEEEDGSESLVGEVEIMIATRHDQLKGYGRAALLTFIRYVLRHEQELLREYDGASKYTKFDYLRAKVKETNCRSIGLLESLGFVKTEPTPNWFEEFELRLVGPTEDKVDQLMRQRGIEGYREGLYTQRPGKTSRPVNGGGALDATSAQLSQ